MCTTAPTTGPPCGLTITNKSDGQALSANVDYIQRMGDGARLDPDNLQCVLSAVSPGDIATLWNVKLRPWASPSFHARVMFYSGGTSNSPGAAFSANLHLCLPAFIAQHAIGDPEFQKRALTLVHEKVSQGKMPGAQEAYLFDQIAMHEGRPQRFSTQSLPCPDEKYRRWKTEDPEP